MTLYQVHVLYFFGISWKILNLSRSVLYIFVTTGTVYLTYNEYVQAVNNIDDDDDHEGLFALIFRKTQKQGYPELFNLFSTRLGVI